MRYGYNITRVAVFIVTFSSSSFANPDVVFKDSDVYLKHELKGKTVKFLLSQPVADIELPDEFFDVKDLVSYVDEKHVFPSDALKLEFLRMMYSSFESKFTFPVFMDELSKVLDGFKNYDGEKSEGCSTMNQTSMALLLVSFALFSIWRRRHRV